MMMALFLVTMPSVGDTPPAGKSLPMGDPQREDASWVRDKYLDIAYAKLSPTQTLDIYLPNEGSGPFPVILAIHGGAFLFGDKADRQLHAPLQGVRHGYAVVSVNYRLAGEAVFPAGVQDVKAAVRFLRAHARKYRLDPGRIAAWGDSAGGYYAAMLGTTGKDPRFDAPELGNPDFSSEVQAVVAWFAPVYLDRLNEQFRKSGKGSAVHDEPGSPVWRFFGEAPAQVPEKVKASYPSAYATKDLPPFLIEHGEEDSSVPVQQSIDLAQDLATVAGKDRVTLRLIPGANHAGPEFITDENLQVVFDFLDGVLKKKP